MDQQRFEGDGCTKTPKDFLQENVQSATSIHPTPFSATATIRTPMEHHH
jgi:hypothetical protein